MKAISGEHIKMCLMTERKGECRKEKRKMEGSEGGQAGEQGKEGRTCVFGSTEEFGGWLESKSA